MTRKEALKQIAQRCMEGDDVESQFYKNAIVTITDEVKEAKWWEHYRNAAYLEMVAKLEAELLPDVWHFRLYKQEGVWCVRSMRPDGMNPIYTSAPTEPLARLAALCLALYEMEE